MGRSLILFIFLLIGFSAKSQSFTENDSLISKVVIVLPNVTSAQLNSVKTEFAKYAQIQKAVFVYGNHNCLLVDLNMNLNTPSFIYYRELIKIMCASINPADIKIKTPVAYSEISNAVNDSKSTVIK